MNLGRVDSRDSVLGVNQIKGCLWGGVFGYDGSTGFSGKRVARELTALIRRRGKPGMIVSDNGTELTSNAILSFADSDEGARL